MGICRRTRGTALLPLEAPLGDDEVQETGEEPEGSEKENGAHNVVSVDPEARSEGTNDRDDEAATSSTTASPVASLDTGPAEPLVGPAPGPTG